MIGDPRNYDTEAFPNFGSAIGHHAVLQAGDLLYLPYGWWHWLRNLDHLTTSVSFWCTTPAADLSNGCPAQLSDHMLTRVRRNMENMIAQQFGGPTKHSENMLQLKRALEEKDDTDPIVQTVRKLLGAIKMPVEKQDRWLLDQLRQIRHRLESVLVRASASQCVLCRCGNSLALVLPLWRVWQSSSHCGAVLPFELSLSSPEGGRATQRPPGVVDIPARPSVYQGAPQGMR